MRAERRFRGVRRRVGMAVRSALVLGISGCGGAVVPEPEPINMERELDILMVCSAQTLELAGYSLASNSADTRRISTVWREVGELRHRAYVTVLMHPSYGPGVSARLEQQSRNTLSDGSSTATEPGDGSGAGEWQTLASTPESTRWQQRYLAEVQDCWRQQREAPSAVPPSEDAEIDMRR